MTEELQAARDAAAAAARGSAGHAVARELRSKGTSFGNIAATADPAGKVAFDMSGVTGVDPDLVVRPMGWKGDAPLRAQHHARGGRRAWACRARRSSGPCPGRATSPDLDGGRRRAASSPSATSRR